MWLSEEKKSERARIASVKQFKAASHQKLCSSIEWAVDCCCYDRCCGIFFTCLQVNKKKWQNSPSFLDRLHLPRLPLSLSLSLTFSMFLCLIYLDCLLQHSYFPHTASLFSFGFSFMYSKWTLAILCDVK